MFDEGLAELHTHLGGSVASEILWSLAHEQGIALPVKDYWEFERLVTVSDPRGVPNLDALDQIYHWTELIQSSPIAVERSVHAAIGGAYRSQHITTLELRFNPMKRNRGGERDLDHIILAAIRGLDLASIEYPQVRAGLILMMDRTFDARLNEIIVDKAIKWASRGVVGVDIAGPRPGGGRYDYTQVAPMVETAREAGLGVTIHVGEEGGDMGREEIAEVVEVLRPDRIGHGILAAGDPELMAAIREREIVLEICPTSNLLDEGAGERRRGARDVPALRRAWRAVHDRDGRAGDDADPPARRVRAAAADRCARRGRGARSERARPRVGVQPRTPSTRAGVTARRYVFRTMVAQAARWQARRMSPVLKDQTIDLTARQRQVVALIAAGCSNDEVGAQLGISPRTAKAHCDVLRQKLGVPRRRQIPAAYRALTGDDPLAHDLGAKARVEG